MGESASDAKKELFLVKEQDTHIVGVGYKIYIYVNICIFICI